MVIVDPLHPIASAKLGQLKMATFEPNVPVPRKNASDCTPVFQAIVADPGGDLIERLLEGDRRVGVGRSVEGAVSACRHKVPRAHRYLAGVALAQRLS